MGFTALAICLCAGVGLVTNKSPYGLEKAGALRGFKENDLKKSLKVIESHRKTVCGLFAAKEKHFAHYELDL